MHTWAWIVRRKDSVQFCVLAVGLYIGYDDDNIILWPFLGELALSVAPRLSVCPSVCPSRASEFLETGKPQKLLI